MYSNLNEIRRSLPKDGKIFEVRAMIKSFSNGFLAITLPQLADQLEMLHPKKVSLDLSWRKELLVAKNRLTIRRFMERIKKKNIHLNINIPLCLPGWENYKRIKKFTSPDNCDRCVFKIASACHGLISCPDEKLIFFDLPLKDFDQISLKDFVPPKNKEPITWFIPRKKDIERIVRLAEVLNSKKNIPYILDVGAGGGFLAYLLAQTERVKVTAVEPNKELIKRTKFKSKNLNMVAGRIESYRPKQKFELAINSFMPYKLDLSPLIKKIIRPKAIIYIQDKKMALERNYTYLDLIIDDKRKIFDYKIDSSRSYNPDEGYKKIFAWDVYSAGYPYKKIPLLGCEIEVQLREDLEIFDANSVFNVNRQKEYKWEKQIKSLKT